jgi:hypothetical protein
MDLGTYAGLLNQRIIIPSAKGNYIAVERHFFNSYLSPLLAKVKIDEKWYLEAYPDVREAIEVIAKRPVPKMVRGADCGQARGLGVKASRIPAVASSGGTEPRGHDTAEDHSGSGDTCAPSPGLPGRRAGRCSARQDRDCLPAGETAVASASQFRYQARSFELDDGFISERLEQSPERPASA